MEIGSEFWKFDGNLINDNSKFWSLGKDTRFVLSGRTAIFYVLKNILVENNVKKAYLPSYSCDSMAQPFIDLGIEIEYYDVYFNEELKYNIDLENDSDIFFAMNYFGYSETNMEKYIKKFKEKGKIVIEDITHSILSKKRYSEYSDFLIASLRKWFPISSGAIAINVKETFKLDLLENTNDRLVTLKTAAMENKKNYINKVKEKSLIETQKEKDVFLKEYSESNKILESDYQNYKIDEKSYKILMGIDIEEIVKKRRKNAKLIYEKLSKNINIKFLINNFKEDDCLLFVPIILNHKIRDDLRKFLIENTVYLPVHWPQEEKINNIFDKELSLICDQRYSYSEINYYLELILKFLKLNSRDNL